MTVICSFYLCQGYFEQHIGSKSFSRELL